MICVKKTNAEIYDFFDNFDDYDKFVDIPSVSFNIGGINKGCDSLNFDNNLTNISSQDNICKQFKFLHSKLFQDGDKQKEESYNKKHCSFLNYWINNKLYGKDNNASICVKDFYDKMKETDSNFFVKDLCGNYVYNLEKYDLKNMNVLYNLYSIKNRISILRDRKTSIEGSCSQYVKECYDKYNEGIINCEDNCSAFCIALQLFKAKYDPELRVHSSGSGPCKGEEIVVLPDCNEVMEEYQTERNKQMKNTTLTILIPTFAFILALIFKFKPFGQFLGKKIWKKNIMNSDYEKENVLLSHLSDVENINFDDGEYNVGYYSSSNS